MFIIVIRLILAVELTKMPCCSVLVSIRRQYTACVGQRIVLPCHPSIPKDVDWKYRPSETGFEDYVYSNGVMYERFNSSMKVVKSRDGDYDLVIFSVRLADTGHYHCIEDLGLGARHIAELHVSGKFSVCLFTVSLLIICYLYTYLYYIVSLMSFSLLLRRRLFIKH